jgi:hypothetical protein
VRAAGASDNVVCRNLVPTDEGSYSSGAVVCSVGSGHDYQDPPSELRWAINSQLVPTITPEGEFHDVVLYLKLWLPSLNVP